jgi:Na+/melibiose symporter-like transporter
VTANVINGQNQNLSRLAGSALSGIVAAIGGIALVALVDAGTFVLSAVLLALIRTSGRVERTTSVQTLTRSLKQQLAPFRTDLGDVLRLMMQTRVHRTLIIFTLVTSAGEGIMGTPFAPFIRHVLHGSNRGIAILGGALTAGILGQSVGIIPVPAFQGGSYVVAGLVLWMRWQTKTSPKDVTQKGLHTKSPAT